MTSRSVPSLLLASVLATVAFTASAQNVTLSGADDATSQAQQGNEASVAASSNSNARPDIDRHCLRQTGSRIVARANTARTNVASDRNGQQGKRCVAANGRVYSRDDLDRTGEVDIADALRKLDPAIY